MTSIWGIEKKGGGSPSPEDLAEISKHIPKFEFKPRAVPQEYKIIWQTADGLQDAWTKMGLYCPACFCVGKDLGRFSNFGNRNPESFYVRWEVRLQSLVEAAESGCQFCSFMAVRFFNDPGYTFVWGNHNAINPIACCGKARQFERSDKVEIAIGKIRKFYEKYVDTSFTLIIQPLDYSVDPQGQGRYGKLLFQVSDTNLRSQPAVKEILGFRREIILEVYAADNVSSRFLRYLPVVTDYGSELGFHIARQWIKDCTEGHPECQTSAPHPLPTRVVEILDEQNLRLSHIDAEDRYVTLSYCWGDQQSFITTKKSLSSMQYGFEVSQLPQTLQDAVKVTKALQIKYLWVDALCIIQDSEDDKGTELPMMSSYYKNSYVTLCAGGNRCSSGFLKKQDTCEKHPSHLPQALLTFPVLCPEGETGLVHFCEELPYALSQEPVSSRAWTFQERVLSPRVLSYGGRLIWQCHSAQRSAGGLEDWESDVRSQGHRRLHLELHQKNTTTDQETLQSGDAPKTANLYDMWHRSVKEYSYRDLTYGEDKFPAVSGLASEFGLLTGDDYLAGLWRSQFLRGLLWSTYPKPIATRCESWRAPTWSWASTTDPISYDRLPPLDAIPMAEVVDVSVTPKATPIPFSYGEITSASLTIKGPVLREQNEMALALLAQDNRLSRQEDTTSWRLNIFDIMSTRKFASLSETMDFKLPQKTALLVLFAVPIQEDVVENEIQKQEDKTKGQGVSHGAQPDEASEDTDVKDFEDEDEHARATISGLILDEISDGSFQRIGRFTTMRLKGYKYLQARGETIRIA